MDPRCFRCATVIATIGFSMERPVLRENQGNRIEKKDRNQDGIQITLKEELKSGKSKDLRDRFPKEGRAILKWT